MKVWGSIMSRKQLSWIVVLEKIIGFIIMIVGVIVFYNTYSNIKAAGLGAYFFIGTGIALMIIGLIFLIARTR